MRRLDSLPDRFPALARSRGRSSLLVVIACLSAAGCAGDGGPSETATDDAAPATSHLALGFEDFESVRFGEPRKQPREELRRLGLDGKKGFLPQDEIYLEARVFADSLLTPRPIHLDGAYELEFLPLIIGPGVGDAEIETYVVAGGRQERIASSPAFATRSAELTGDQRFTVLKRTARVDLSSYGGQTVALRWVLRRGSPERGKAAIGMPRLRPLARSGLARRERHRPHVLLICVDTLRYDYAVGQRGRELMPRLHELAADAVTYTRASSNASWTLPSIASAISGLYPRFHGTGKQLESGASDEWDPDRKLPPGRFKATFGGRYHVFSLYPRELVTLSEELQRAGYRTAMVVSNFFYIYSGLARDGADVVYDTGTVPGSLVNRAGKALLGLLGDGEPVFLLLHYMDVHQHGGWYGPGARQGTAKDENYRAGVRNADRFLGDFLDEWRRAIGLDETLVVVFSDHGEHLEEGGRRGHGNSMDEVLLHVPLVVKYPASLGLAGGEDDRVVSLVDIHPTILDLAGIDVAGRELSGDSLIGKTALGETGKVVFADFQLYGKELSAAREEDYKLIFDLENRSRKLVAIGSDEGGERERTTENREARQAIEKAFRHYVRQAAALSSGLASDEIIDDEELQERLRALGYVE